MEHYERFLTEQHRLKIANAYEDKIFVVSSQKLKGRRIDSKGYTKTFRELKDSILQSQNQTVLLKDCIAKSVAGEWGLDLNLEEISEDYELCCVLRNTNFDNNFNLDFSDVALRYILTVSR
jgi:hypothetical protein